MNEARAKYAAPIVSVIIPTHDRLFFLKEAISSATRQTDASCEVIVVDDGSRDGTAQWLRTLRDDRVRPVILDANRGRTHARNTGLEFARGRFVLFFDDDDRLRPSALQGLRDTLEVRTTAVAAVGARVLFNDRGQQRRTRHPRWTIQRIVWTDLLLGWLPVPGQVLWRTDAIRQLGGWNADLPIGQPEDRELCVRASRHRPMVITPSTVLESRIHDGQTKNLEGRLLHERWIRRYVDALPPNDRALGYRTLYVRHLLESAGRAYGDFDYRAAISLYLRALRSAPRVLSSPLQWHRVVPPLTKSLLGVVAGHRVMLFARVTRARARPRIRRVLGRDVMRNKTQLANTAMDEALIRTSGDRPASATGGLAG